MTLQKLDIPKQSIQALYGHNLVRIKNDSEAKPAPTEKASKSTKKGAEKKASVPASAAPFLGENKQHVLWIVNDDLNDYADEAGMALLKSILQACGWKMDDVAVINLHNQSLSFESVKTQFQPKYIIALGSAYGFFPANLPLYAQMQFDDIFVITGASLQTMQNEKEAKAKLWNLLKPMFGK